MRKEAEKVIRELVPELQELNCINNKCEEYIRWDCGYGECISCKLQGQSERITGIAKDCKFKQGSEIHLEHIILANRVNQNELAVMYYNEHNIVCKYTADKSFQEQSEEFYKFLVEILK